MPILLYGIQVAPPAEPPPAGVQVHAHGDIVLYYAEYTADRVSQAAALRFFETLETLHAHSTLLAFRYPTLLASQEVLEGVWVAHGEQIKGVMAQVAGHSEFSVRWQFTMAEQGNIPESKPKSGTMYMKQRLDALKKENYLQEKLNNLQELLRRSLVSICKDITFEVEISKRTLTAYLLVHPKEQERYASLLTQLGKELPEWNYLSSGPWPIFAFGKLPML